MSGFTLPLVDSALLQRLASLYDEHGVVTVLAARGAVGEEPIRTALRSRGPVSSAFADEAASLADPRLDGPAHGMVAVLATGAKHRFRLPQPVATLITVGSRADIVPLARAFDGARPIGIVDARLERLRVVEAAHGEARELDAQPLSAAVDWTEFRGPARANPARAYESSSQRERYDRRTRVQRSRALKKAARHISEVARERDWRALVIAGDPRVTGELADQLPSSHRVEAHLPDWESAGRLVHDLQHELDAGRHSAVATLTADARAHPGGYAAGAQAVGAAIDAGQASFVVLGDDAREREHAELAHHALAHALDVVFAHGTLGDLGGVICPLHGGARSCA